MKLMLAIVAGLFLSAPVYAQTVTVTSSALADSSGNLISNATVYFAPVLTNGSPASYRRGVGGGQTTVTRVSALVTSGAFSIVVADTSQTSPANICYAVTVVSNLSGANLLGPGYSCVQPTSAAGTAWCFTTTCNFDLYPPNLAPLVAITPGPQGPQGVPGTSGCSIGTACTGAYFIPSASLDLTGATDNSSVVNSYTSSVKSGLILPPGIIYTPTLSNTNGVPFFGDGHLLRAVSQTATNGSGATVTANREQIDTYAYKGRMVLGREYLVHLSSLLEANAVLGGTVTPIKIIVSGDSTTSGVNATTPYTVDGMLNDTLNDAGAIGVQPVINEGHSGANSTQWLSSFLAPDLAQNPDVYVIRWGINDFPGGITAANTIANIRSGLATIRAAKNVDQQTVILEMPSSTNDNPNGRNRAFYEQLRNGFVQAATDYQAVFVDLYGEMPDTDSYTASMSHDYGTGSTPVVQIHPGNAKNPLYNSALMDAMFPSGFRQMSSTKVWNISSATNSASSTCGPNCYLEAVSLYRATDSGWPYNGAALTFMQADGVWIQYNYSYNATGAPAFAFRLSTSQTTWSGWGYAGPGAPIPTGFGTGVYTGVSSGNPDLLFSNQSAGSNAKLWDIYVDISGTMHVRVLNDTNTAYSDVITLPRAGASPSPINFGVQVSATSLAAGNGYSGTKTAGSCVLTIVSGIITNVTGC